MRAGHWINAFLDALAAERGASINTLSAYKRDLEGFDDWAKDTGTSLAEATSAEVEAFLIHLDTQGLAASTRARKLSALKQFYRFTFEEGWRAENPAIAISGPAKTKSLPKTLSEADVEALLQAARQMGRSEADRLRNTCLLELLYATGMRVSELVSLPVAAARGDPAMLLVRGKGDKERMVPLSAPARDAMALWLMERDAQEAEAAAKTGAKGRAPSRYLFPSRGKAGHLTRTRFYILIKELAAFAGLKTESISPHTLRHAFATHLLANGADLRVIQTLLGHADLSTTEIYTHVLEERLKALVETHHPLAKG